MPDQTSNNAHPTPRPSQEAMEEAEKIVKKAARGTLTFVDNQDVKKDLITSIALALDHAKAEERENLRSEKKISHYEGVKDGLRKADEIAQKVKTSNCGNPRKCGQSCGQCRFHAGFQSCKRKILSALSLARKEDGN